jgi:tRNA modification GTPase
VQVTQEPTTAALCTAPGRGGIAVVTLIGPRAEEILSEIFTPIGDRKDDPENRLQLGRLADNRTGESLDKVIVCKTACGVEINIHGGPHIARRLMSLLADLGAQPRNPDEQSVDPLCATHPKWNNPAIGAELLTALPQARSMLATAALSAQWSGGLSRLAHADEPSAAQLRAAAGGLKDIEKLLNPIEVVLAGPPNAGKSTLTNALVGRQVSIVHQTAGTTRDWVREPAVISGVPIWLTDTAGLWKEARGVDSEAVRRAQHCAAQADILILLDPHGAAPGPDWLASNADRPTILSVKSKCDETCDAEPGDCIRISAMTGLGIDNLKAAIVAAAGLDGFEAKTPRAFTARQARCLFAAADAIEAGDPTASQRVIEELLRGPIV